MISSPPENLSYGINSHRSDRTIIVYKNIIKGFDTGIIFDRASENLVFNNIFESNKIDISDLPGPFPGGGINFSICNKCSDGKCNGCVITG